MRFLFLFLAFAVVPSFAFSAGAAPEPPWMLAPKPPLPGPDAVRVERLAEPLPAATPPPSLFKDYSEADKERYARSMEGFLWNHFANQPEEEQFRDYPVAHWRANFAPFSEALLRKAREKQLPVEPLRRALAAVFAEPLGEHSLADFYFKSGSTAYLPVGAYETTLAGQPVWILVVKWENDDPALQDCTLGHIRMFVFDQATGQQVGFSTCG